MKFKLNILCIYFFWAICVTNSVNIARLKESNQFQNLSGIGPPCGVSDPFKTTCTLDNGKVGQCAEWCITPPREEAKFCCHIRSSSILYIYFCCEEGQSIVRGYGVGGFIAKDNEFPYMAALGWYTRKKISSIYEYKCGGALISRKFSLTAGHCSFINGTEPIVLLPGGKDLNRYDIFSVPYVIEAVYVHPDYDDEFAYNDIALVQIVGEHGGPTIDIWRRSYIANASFAAAGYGDTTFGGTSSDVLIKVFLQHFATNDCQRFYADEENTPSGITSKQLCAKDPDNKMDTCQGDSGGPLIMTTYNQIGDEKKEYLVGITSFGLGCASSAPGVYTRVAPYTQWINKTIAPFRVANNSEDESRQIWLR